ncbi:MAG: radical SAM protein [Nitrospina sp.]|jgi:anaerobic magnesium-protoporphyrin IX monomethyl ester cyclase|nr:radical SAM protein [Nitrospina sp.]
MKVYAVSMDRNILSIGFRRVVAVAKKAGFDVDSIYFLDDFRENTHSGSWWRQKTGEGFGVNFISDEEKVSALAQHLSKGDVVAFSVMSVQRNLCKTLCKKVKELNPDIKIILGSYHPTIFPEDAIEFSDAIAIGEGELIFVDFLNRVKNSESLEGLEGTWTNINGKITKNPDRELMTKGQMEDRALMDYTLENNYIYSVADESVIPLTEKIFYKQVGTVYNTIWSVGCPYRCSFCSQDLLNDMNPEYAQFRGPSPAYMVNEIKEVQKRFAIDYVIFYDSDFMGRSLEELKEFGRLFPETGLKFILSGTNPATIREEKMRVLTDAGLVRIKMGMESGNDEMLEFFKRPAKTKELRKTSEILSKFKDKMVAPAFEMIIDNPLESKDQLYQTIDFLHSLSGPFTLSLFSMHFMPGTALSRTQGDDKFVAEQFDKEYMFSYKPNALNNLLSIFAILKPSPLLLKILKKFVSGKEEKKFPRLKTFLYRAMLFRRAMDSVRFGDYSNFPAWVMFVYHKTRQLKLNLLSG